MQFQLDQSIEVLASTPSVLDALLRGKSSAWLNCRKSPDAFSPIDVLGHLMLADETDWLPRVRMILAGHTHTPFEPFDRFDFQRLIAGKSIDSLLNDFATLRSQSLQTLTSLHITEEQLDLPGTHPEFGPVTLRNLLATWVVHDLGHIQQIVKTMSNEYREAVGPWRAYLSILH
ncbi:DinB family protein [Granulicella sp. L46]|uniref:DinB family protein n=1 Tax=Granulicella sp. L46 TaxID=1641865 RepID=UPI00131BD785|nr:DinB family protein [Granulicella sp. L46]